MGRPSIVMLHGVGLDHTMWEPIAELLGSRFTILAPDLPGHGQREPVRAGATLADLAAGVADEIPPGSHLVGFSLGALVGQHLAIHQPDVVATLTSVSSVCRRTPAEREAVLNRLDVASADFGAAVAASLQRWYAGTDVASMWVKRTETTLLANDIESFLHCYRVFATGDADVAQELGRIAVPGLAITGEKDRGSTPEMTHRLAAAIPTCRAVIVPGARHMLPVEHPEVLANGLESLIGDNSHV